MAKEKVKKEEGEKEEVNVNESNSSQNSAQKAIQGLLNDKRFKGTHFNDKKERLNWHVSTGSTTLDYILSSDGQPGLTSQILKIYGEFGTGKSSFLLNIAKNFQKLGKNFFVLYADAEGRLSEKLIQQSGIDTSPDKWFVLKSNQAETVFGIIREILQKNNDLPEKDYMYYCILVDSLDGLVRAEDKIRDFDSQYKVAGNALLTKTFVRTTSLPITYGKHLFLSSGQVISRIDVNSPGAKKTGPSGGKAIGYFSSTILEVIPTWTKTKIWENPSGATIKEKGKEIGHYFELNIDKSINNTKAGERGVMIPIKREFEPGEAIYREVECKDLMIMWELLKPAGMGRFEMDGSFSKQLTEANIDHETKFHGDKSILDHLESNPKLVDFAMTRLRSILFS